MKAIAKHLKAKTLYINAYQIFAAKMP